MSLRKTVLVLVLVLIGAMPARAQPQRSRGAAEGI